MDLEDILLSLGLGLLASLLVFLLAIAGAIMGAFTGFCISLVPFLRDWISTGLSIFGFNINGHFVELGATLGFIGGFFRATFEYSRKRD